MADAKANILASPARPVPSPSLPLRVGMTVGRAAFVLAIFLVACTTQPKFLERSVTLGDHEYRYRVSLPAHYTKLHHWPVILFLHGSGERGDDNVRQLSIGLPAALDRLGGRYKAVIIFPQCREGQEWYGDMEMQALAALEQTIREFH